MNLTYERPPLAEYQVTALFTPARYAAVEAATKLGKTTGALVWAAERAFTRGSGHHVWWLAPIRVQAKMAYRRLKAMLPRPIYRANASDVTITLRNGAVIAFKSADHPDALYGEDVYAAVIDEATRVKEEAWHAIRSTLTAVVFPVK